MSTAVTGWYIDFVIERCLGGGVDLIMVRCTDLLPAHTAIGPGTLRAAPWLSTLVTAGRTGRRASGCHSSPEVRLRAGGLTSPAPYSAGAG